MKILITSDTFAPMLNGVVVSIHNLMDELQKCGHEVRVLALSENTEAHVKDNVYSIPSFPLKIYPNARGPLYDNPFQNDLLHWGPDIVHSQTEFFTFTFGSRIAKRLHIPMIHTYHTLYEHYTNYIFLKGMNPQKVLGLFVRTKLRNLDAVIVPSYKAMESLETMGVSKPMRVIPTGIDLSAFAPQLNADQRHQLRAQLNIPADAQIIVTVGRLAKEKNVQELLAYFCRLSELDQRIIFLIVGDGPYREHLNSLAHNLGLSSRVRFTGLVPPHDIYKYYQLGQIYVNASTSETQGLTYLEALASGIPLVCRRDSCLEEILGEGKNGYYFESEEEYVEHTLNCLRDEPQHRKMRGYALETAQHFSKETFGASVEQFYFEMLQEQREKMAGKLYEST